MIFSCAVPFKRKKKKIPDLSLPPVDKSGVGVAKYLSVSACCRVGFLFNSQSGNQGCGSDPHHLNANLDPGSAINTVGIWIRIRILLLIKMMRICDQFSKDPPGLH